VLYIGAVVVVVLAFVLSSFQKAKHAAANKQAAAQPVVQDDTASNVKALQQQVAADKARDKQDAAMAAAAGTPSQQAAAGSYRASGQSLPCQPGQYCPPSQGTNNNGQPPALTPVHQQEQQLAAKERDRQFTSRFESIPCIQSRRDGRPAACADSTTAGYATAAKKIQTNSKTPTPLPCRLARNRTSRLAEASAQTTALQNSAYKPGSEINVDSAVGQRYVLYEGTTLDTVLMNRLDGDAPGPV
jgi:hypothetical protein